MLEDRILVLQPIEGATVKSSTGMPDKRLFTGENKLHAYSDYTGLWYLKYDRGDVPPAMKQKFTGFNRLHNFVRDYFKNRGIEIVKVIDNAPNE